MLSEMGLRIIYGNPTTPPDGILFLPDDEAIRSAVLNEIGDGGAIIGARTFSPYSYVKDLAEYFDLPDTIGNPEKIMIVRNIMGNIPALAEGSGMISYTARLASLLTSLRSNRINTGQELLKLLGTENNRIAVLGNLLDAYSTELSKRGLIDEPERFVRITKSFEKDGIPQRAEGLSKISIMGFDEIDGVVAEFYCALAEFVQVDFYVPLPEENPYGKKRTEAANATATAIIKAAEERRREVLNETITRAKTTADEIIFAITGESKELQDIPLSPIANWPILTSLVGRNPSEQADIIASAVKYLILQHGLSYSDIAIYAKGVTENNIRRALDQHGLPTLGKQEKNLTETAFVEVLRRFFGLLRSGFGREELRRLLSNKLIDHEKTAVFDNIAISRSIIGGLPVEDSWLRLLESSDEEEAGELRELIITLADITGRRKWTDRLSGSEFFKIIKDFAEKFDLKDSIVSYVMETNTELAELEAEIAAFEKLIDLEELFKRTPVDTMKSHVDFLLFLFNEAISCKGGAGIKIFPPDNISRACSRVVIIADVVQGEFPPPAPSYPFLSSREAEQLGLVLPEFAYRKDYEFLSVLEKAELTILTRPLAEEDSPKPPATVLIALENALGKNGEKYYRQMETITLELTSLPYSNKRSQIMAGEVMMSSFPGDDQPNPLLLVGAEIQRAARAIAIDKKLRSGIGREYTGTLPREFSIVFRNRFKAFSVSDIENYAVCPFMFFASKVLDIKPMEDVQEGIPADIAGKILHAVLEQFYRESIESVLDGSTEIKERIQILTANYDNLAPLLCVTPENIDESRKRIFEIARIKLKESASLCPSRLAFDSMEYILVRSLENYLEISSHDCDFSPIAVEIGFTGEIGGTKIYGKADRIDSDREGRLRIIDYKWGRCPGANQILKGEALQLPLYAILSGLPSVASIGYYNNFKKQIPQANSCVSRIEIPYGKSINVDEWDRLIDNVRRETEIIIERIHTGDFPPLPRGDDCPGYCPFGGICGYNRLVSIPGEDE